MRPVHVFEWLSVLSILGIVGDIGLGVYSPQRKAWLARDAVWNARMPAPTSSAGSPTPA